MIRIEFSGESWDEIVKSALDWVKGMKTPSASAPVQPTVAPLKTAEPVAQDKPTGQLPLASEIAPKPPTKRRGRPPKTEQVAAPADVKAEAQHEPEASDEPLTLGDVTKALQEVVSTKGIDAARGLLSEFESERVSTLPAKHFKKFIKRCEETCQ